MASVSDRKKLLYKIARAYYEDELTQAEIGKRFGLSRIKISRLLQQAREEKIVQITVTPFQDPNTELEEQIETHYNLDEAVVVTPSFYDKETIAHELGQASVDCLLRSLQGHETVAISWGTTLLAVVEALPSQYWPDMKIVQMLGGLGPPESETHATDLTRRMAQAFGAKPRLLPAPGIVNNQMVRDALLADPQIADTLALAANADIGLVGIGIPVPDSVVMQAGAILPTQAESLKQEGAVGDIALCFFDADGQPIEHEINNLLIGLTLDQIKSIPRVIAVAGGLPKLEVIRAALRGNLINVLVTDSRVAARLV